MKASTARSAIRCSNGEISYSLAEAKVLIEAWRRHDNTQRPHSSLGYRPPAPETATPPCTNNQPGPPVGAGQQGHHGSSRALCELTGSSPSAGSATMQDIWRCWDPAFW